MPTGELSTTAIVEDALKSHKEVFVPYIHSIETTTTQQKTSVMDMLALDSMEEFTSLERDKWGIPSLTEANAFPTRRSTRYKS
jgi:5-formyltetrahydrofolate cyclo-ligase